MAKYVLLLNWTDQGIHEYQDSTKRAERVSEWARNLGGNLREVYWTLGPYDVVAMAEFPDDEAATTLRAFDKDEIQAIIGRSTSV
jgi:uncharacterized protein with GYD domain